MALFFSDKRPESLMSATAGKRGILYVQTAAPPLCYLH
jgi:hypothetical protein